MACELMIFLTKNTATHLFIIKRHICTADFCRLQQDVNNLVADELANFSIRYRAQ